MIFEFLSDIVSGAWSVIEWIANLLGTMTAPLQAFLTGGTQMFAQTMDAFSGISASSPLYALSFVAVVGVGYIIIRIIIHLL